MENKNKIILMQEEQNGGRQMYIEYLKGLAIFSIVIMHIEFCYMPSSPDYISKILQKFLYSPRVFFFCSGFGLYYSYLRHPLRWSDFIKKRFVKVYLPYILIVFICFFVPYTYEYDDRFAALLSHIFLYKMFIPKYIGSFGPFWFMSSIFQYYLLFYVIVKMKDKVNNNTLFTLIWIGISLIWSLLGGCFPLFKEKIDWVYDACFLGHGIIFVLGMLCAESLYQNKEFSITAKQLLVVCIAMAICIILLHGNEMYTLKEIPWDVMLLCLFTIAWIICGNTLRKFGGWIGAISFEWYLTHMLILEGCYRFIKPIGLTNEVLFAGAGLTLTIFAAWLYHQFVKRVLFCKIKL